MNIFLPQLSNTKLFFILFGAYILCHSNLIFSDRFPIRDSLTYDYSTFVLFSGSLRHFGRPPEWFTAWGGWPSSMGLPSLYFLLPHKLLGYLSFVITRADTLLLFKLADACGVVFTAVGWSVMLRAWKFSPSASFLSSLCFLASGIGLTVFHQNQVLATVFWYPFLLLAIKKWRGGEITATPALIFAGLLFSNHLPVIHFYTLSLCFVWCMLFARKHIPKRGISVGSIAAFLIVLIPAVAIVLQARRFESPIRIDDLLFAGNLEDYIMLNMEQDSSARWQYFLNFVWPGSIDLAYGVPVHGQDDVMNFFITRIGLLLAVIGAIAWWKRSWPITLLSIFFGLASLGINGGVAQVFYLLHMPGINAFRQWYHFSSLFILSLCLLIAIGADWLLMQSWIMKWKNYLLALIGVGIILDGSSSSWIYFKKFAAGEPVSHLVHGDKAGFSDFYSNMSHLSMFAYRNTFTFLKLCKQWNRREAIVVPIGQMDTGRSEPTCPTLPGFSSLHTLRAHPTGVEGILNLNGTSRVVFPVSYDLVQTVRLNGAKLGAVDFHGLASVVAGPGKYSCEVNVASRWQLISWIALTVLMFWGLFRVFRVSL